jgi:hypothetical protein
VELNEKIRVSLLRLSTRNGGLRDLTQRAHIPYSTLWNQINRQHGILASVIPPIVSATGDPILLSMIADACGFIVAPKPKFKRTRREVRQQETGLAIAVGEALKVIERALTDGLINSAEHERIDQALRHISSHALEIEEIIDKGRFLRKRSR